jgi:xanthine dehydrogenase small subunit
VRGRKLTTAAIGAAVEALRADIKPIDDMRSTAKYRLTVAGRLLGEFLSALSEQRR